MKKLLLIVFLSPLLSAAQSQLVKPRFENDTLYTGSGYKVYKGQVLHLGNGTDRNGNFRYIKYNISQGKFITNGMQNTTVVVKKMKSYIVTPLGNAYMYLKGVITYKDGSKGGVELTINFERAIENIPSMPSELIVPDEFRSKRSVVSAKVEMLNKLYQDSVITKEQFEIEKAKLLNE